MKHTKRTITLLLTAAMLSTCLLPLAGCQSTTPAPESPFNDTLPPDEEKKGDDVNEEKKDKDGEKADVQVDLTDLSDKMILYGKEDSSTGSILRWGDMMIGMTNYGNLWGYFSFDEPRDARLICFDPLCTHGPGLESCPANLNREKVESTPGNPAIPYPMGIYIDHYESVDSPVIYYFYLRSDFYRINYAETAQRDPVYCIERYDLSKGRREVIMDNVENTILKACNYGDYIYYVLDMGDDKGQELYRIGKSGGDPVKFDLDEKADSLRIADAIDDKFYYIVNEKYIYRADLDLSGSEMVLDMSTVKGANDSNGVIQGSYSGYLYYLADFETVWAGEPDESPSAEKANLYRIPMNDLTQAPERVVEGMIGTGDCYRFTEKTLYYEPCVNKFDDSVGGDTAINLCDGKLFALDLKTGESKLIVENSGMTIYPYYAWDDVVVFGGWSYNSIGNKFSDGNRNLLVAFASGEPFRIWCQGNPAAVTDEYLETLRAQVYAAIETSGYELN